MDTLHFAPSRSGKRAMLAATRIRIDWLALVAGVVLAALALAGWRVEGGHNPPPADVALLVTQSQDLAVTTVSGSDEGKALRGSAPEDGVARSLEIRNATGSKLDVRLTATAVTSDLDEALTIRIVTRGETLFEGPLGALRAGTTAFSLESHETSDVQVLAWIPTSSDAKSWGARSEQVQLQLLTTPNTP